MFQIIHAVHVHIIYEGKRRRIMLRSNSRKATRRKDFIVFGTRRRVLGRLHTSSETSALKQETFMQTSTHNISYACMPHVPAHLHHALHLRDVVHEHPFHPRTQCDLGTARHMCVRAT